MGMDDIRQGRGPVAPAMNSLIAWRHIRPQWLCVSLYVRYGFALCTGRARRPSTCWRPLSAAGLHARRIGETQFGAQGVIQQ